MFSLIVDGPGSFFGMVAFHWFPFSGVRRDAMVLVIIYVLWGVPSRVFSSFCMLFLGALGVCAFNYVTAYIFIVLNV